MKTFRFNQCSEIENNLFPKLKLIKNLHYFFFVFKSLFLINEVIMLVRQFVSKGNQIHSEFFYHKLTFLKNWKMILFFNLKTHCFSVYYQVDVESIKRFHQIRYAAFSQDIILLPRPKKLGNIWRNTYISCCGHIHDVVALWHF